MNQQHSSTAILRPPQWRMQPALALTLACGMTLAAAMSHASTNAAGAAPHAGHPMPAAAKSPPATTTPPAAATTHAAFTYRRFTFDEPLANWREVNDTVRAIGGWRAYLKEVQDAQAREKAAPVDGKSAVRGDNKTGKDTP